MSAALAPGARWSQERVIALGVCRFRVYSRSARPRARSRLTPTPARAAHGLTRISLASRTSDVVDQIHIRSDTRGPVRTVPPSPSACRVDRAHASSGLSDGTMSLLPARKSL